MLKYKQNTVYVPQGKINLLVLIKKYDTPIDDHGGKKHHHRVVSRRSYSFHKNDDTIHFVKICVRCQVYQISYRKQINILQPLPILLVPLYTMAMTYYGHGFHHKFVKVTKLWCCVGDGRSLCQVDTHKVHCGYHNCLGNRLPFSQKMGEEPPVAKSHCIE